MAIFQLIHDNNHDDVTVKTDYILAVPVASTYPDAGKHIT